MTISTHDELAGLSYTESDHADNRTCYDPFAGSVHPGLVMTRDGSGWAFAAVCSDYLPLATVASMLADLQMVAL